MRPKRALVDKDIADIVTLDFFSLILCISSKTVHLEDKLFKMVKKKFDLHETLLRYSKSFRKVS